MSYPPSNSALVEVQSIFEIENAHDNKIRLNVCRCDKMMYTMIFH